MRKILSAAALAVLALAAPAAAQPEGPALMRQARERLVANAPEQVRDYTLTLVHENQRTPVYVSRQGTEWEVQLPESPLGEFLAMAVFWPEFTPSGDDDDGMSELDDAVYLRQETVEGRRVHLVTIPVEAALREQGLDSTMFYVDAQNRQLVRVSVLAPVPDDESGGMAGFGGGAQMAITIDAGDYRETDGLTVPRNVRVRLRVRGPNMDREALQMMRDQMAAALDELASSTEPEAAEMLSMLRTFTSVLSEEGLDQRVTIEDVVVNPGPPAWLDEEN